MNTSQKTPLDSKSTGFVHIPVLSQEVISALNIRPNGHYLDATVGGGGHSEAILQTYPDVKVTALDWDEQAIIAAKQRLSEYESQIQFVLTSFADFDYKDASFDGIIADLGVSSYHLDTAERGFSFRNTAPLDMRMDRRRDLTAQEIINNWDENELADIFFKYGEERLSRRIARRIVEKRPFTTTTELAEAIAYSVPKQYRYGRIHPATRVFQALRIVVNEELTAIENFLDRAPISLIPGGRIVVISFHSLEDRIVKHKLRESSLRVITKKPITAQNDELENNARSRSAKLRVGEALQID